MPDGVIIFAKAPAPKQKPEHQKKPTQVLNSDMENRLQSNISQDLFKDSDASTSRLDSSFASFVNPTETQGEQDVNLELVFHNKALHKIFG